MVREAVGEMVKFRKFLITTWLSLLLLNSTSARAETLFEGYSKVMSDGNHIGFSIAKYEMDAKKKQWIAKTYTKVAQGAGGFYERLTAFANEDMSPISYSYTSVEGDGASKNSKTKTIEATFKKNKMSATITETGKPIQRIQRDIPKGTFLSCFLIYLMGKSPKGLVVDTKYDYQAIAEEDASIEKGMAYIKNIEDFSGQKAFRILNEFKKNQFVSYVNEKGEVLSTKSPTAAISTELVPLSTMALGNISMSAVIVKNIFSEIPLGITNEVTRIYQEQKKPKDSAVALPNEPQLGSGKQSGVPPGKGLILKSQNSSEEKK